MKRKNLKISFVLLLILTIGYGYKVNAQKKEVVHTFENSKVTYPSECVKNRTLILKPTGNSFAKEKVYNPTVIASGDSLHMIYRTEGVDTHSGVFALAYSKDGINFDQYSKNPFMRSDAGEIGVEDPRVVKYGDNYYLFYIVNLGTRASIQVATSTNLRNWEKQGEILHIRNKWEKKQIKAPAPVPQKINNKYWCYYQGEKEPWKTKMGIAVSDDLVSWIQMEKPVLLPRKNYFDSWGTEPEVAVIVKQGILLLYAGWGGDGTCLNKMGWALFDKNDPTKVIKRCKKPIVALNDGHIFGEGLEFFNGEWKLYYSARDQWIEGVTLDIDELLK